MSEILLVHKLKEGKVYHLELNLPEKRNILSLEMIQSLTNQLESLSQDPNIHLLILSGRGGHFCAGGDLRWMALSQDSPNLENVNQVKTLSKMFYAFSRFPFPVIGKIQGSVFGGGLGLVSLCDVAVAHQDSQFCFSELKLALVPSIIAPFVLEKIPAGQARELMLTARVFQAKEAKKLGLIHFLGDQKECNDYITNLTDQILSYDKGALKQIKKLLNTLPKLLPEEVKDYTVQTLAERRQSPEVIKQINRFLKSRKNKKA